MCSMTKRRVSDGASLSCCMKARPINFVSSKPTTVENVDSLTNRI